MLKKKRKLIYWSISIIAVIILWNSYNKLLIYTHKLTPVGEELVSDKQMEKDVEYIFRKKYSTQQVHTLKLKDAIRLETPKNSKEIFLRAFQSDNDNSINVSITDKRLRWNGDINVHREGQEIAFHQALKFLDYFINHKYDSSIKTVRFCYTPQNFDESLVGTCVVFVLDDFKNEFERLKEMGLEGNELENKLKEKFFYFNYTEDDMK